MASTRCSRKLARRGTTGASDWCLVMDEIRTDGNSKRSRVEPVFGGLVKHSGHNWPSDLLRLADGITVDNDAGKLLQATFLDEIKVPPTSQRLAWMIRNAPLLAPSDGRLYFEYDLRVSSHPQVGSVLARLDAGDTSAIPRKLVFEGDTCCDCLIECEKLIIWIEGKLNDWLSPGTKWDVSRDQLARNLEAAWSMARRKNKDFPVDCLLRKSTETS